MTENGKNEETLKSYWAKDIAELLDISTSNLRRWSIDLENEGYSFYRDEHHRRAYLEKDIMPLKKLKEFLANNMSKNDAIKAVVSMFPSYSNGVITIPVNDDEVRLSKLELQYSKAIIITEERFISSDVFFIPNHEFMKIVKAENHIIKSFEKYVNKYVKAVLAQDHNVLRQYNFSTLKNYHNELGCE
nr:hypothetical protein [Priestia flexa]WEZ10416.1 hypothetical protein P5663_21065 [Priestia flexa]